MFIIQIPYLSLDQTFKSGQHLRWIKINDDKFIVINGSKIVKVSQNRDRFCFDCTEAEFYDTWYDYFDIGTDYLLYNYRINSVDEDFVKESSNRGRGIRIIKQNIFEVTIASVIDCLFDGAAERVDCAINNICFYCGKKHSNSIRDAGKIIWNEFPSVEQVLNKADKWMPMFSKTHASILCNICEHILNNGYKKLPLYLRHMFGNDYISSSIKLYALHKLNYMPLNSDMMNIIYTEIDCEDVEDFFTWYISPSNVDCICGLLGRYLYYNKNNPPRRL